MPLGYKISARLSGSNQNARLRRLSRSIQGGNNGAPFRLELISNEEFNIEAGPNVANTNSRRPVVKVFSSEFKNADNTAVVNSVVILGYKNDCGFIELRCAADNSLVFGVDNTFAGGANSVLYLGTTGLMQSDNTKLSFNPTSNTLEVDNINADTVEISGAYSTGITEVNSNTTLNSTHSTVLVNCNSLDRVITPTAATGRVFNIKKIDSSTNTVTINAVVDGVTSPVLSSQYESITIQYDGTTWWIL